MGPARRRACPLARAPALEARRGRALAEAGEHRGTTGGLRLPGEPVRVLRAHRTVPRAPGRVALRLSAVGAVVPRRRDLGRLPRDAPRNAAVLRPAAAATARGSGISHRRTHAAQTALRPARTAASGGGRTPRRPQEPARRDRRRARCCAGAATSCTWTSSATARRRTRCSRRSTRGVCATACGWRATGRTGRREAVDHDVFVNLSDTEGFCLVVADAMAAGLPVVATDVGGIREYGRDGQNMLKIDAARRNSARVADRSADPARHPAPPPRRDRAARHAHGVFARRDAPAQPDVLGPQDEALRPVPRP